MARPDLLTAYRWPFRRQLIIFGLTVLITVFLGYFLDISAAAQKFSRAVSQEGEMKAELIATLAKVSKGEAEVSQMPILQKHIEEWQKKLIPEASVSKVLDDILRIGADNSLYFGLFDPGDSADSPERDFVPLNIVALGSYHGISAFLSQVAGLDSLVKIVHVSLGTEGRPAVVGQKLNDQAVQKNLLTATIYMTIGIIPEKKPNA